MFLCQISLPKNSRVDKCVKTALVLMRKTFKKFYYKSLTYFVL